MLNKIFDHKHFNVKKTDLLIDKMINKYCIMSEELSISEEYRHKITEYIEDTKDFFISFSTLHQEQTHFSAINLNLSAAKDKFSSRSPLFFGYGMIPMIKEEVAYSKNLFLFEKNMRIILKKIVLSFIYLSKILEGKNVYFNFYDSFTEDRFKKSGGEENKESRNIGPISIDTIIKNNGKTFEDFVITSLIYHYI